MYLKGYKVHNSSLEIVKMFLTLLTLRLHVSVHPSILICPGIFSFEMPGLSQYPGLHLRVFLAPRQETTGAYSAEVKVLGVIISFNNFLAVLYISLHLPLIFVFRISDSINKGFKNEYF